MPFFLSKKTSNNIYIFSCRKYSIKIAKFVLFFDTHTCLDAYVLWWNFQLCLPTHIFHFFQVTLGDKLHVLTQHVIGVNMRFSHHLESQVVQFFFSINIFYFLFYFYIFSGIRDKIIQYYHK